MQHFDFNILIRTDYRVDIALVTGAGKPVNIYPGERYYQYFGLRRAL
jgi:hypothetical protein